MDELIESLKASGITRLVDIRNVPRSRRNPQFNRENLPASLEPVGISYTHLPDLGGFRSPQPDSPNLAWRNDSFRGFADYMLTDAFENGLEKLSDLAEGDTVAIMCAEAVPWRCHRSLIADSLTVRGHHVEHIMSPGKTQAHQLTPFAKVDGDRLIYPAEA